MVKGQIAIWLDRTERPMLQMIKDLTPEYKYMDLNQITHHLLKEILFEKTKEIRKAETFKNQIVATTQMGP